MIELETRDNGNTFRDILLESFVPKTSCSDLSAVAKPQ